MAPEPERPEIQPIPAINPASVPMQGAGGRVPMPAGPGSVKGQAGEKNLNRFGLVAMAILTAGLAGAIVFRGDLRPAPQAPQQTSQQAAQQTAHPVQQPAHARPPAESGLSKAPIEPPQSPLPGSLPLDGARPAPNSFSSPQPFFNSSEADALPRISELKPYGVQEPAQQPAGRTVLPAADQLIPRLQPGSGMAAAASGSAAGETAAADPNYCPACQAGAVAGTKTRANALQSGEGKTQHEIATRYLGPCEGKYVYEYTNVTSNMTIGMKILTGGGEVWTFTLKPGEKTSIKSSTQFTSGTFDSYRTSEVIN